jgi:hypothetical protein
LSWASLGRPFGAHLPALAPGERENRLRAQARKNCVFLLRGGVRFQDPDGAHRTPEIGEGGPRQAFSLAVAGRMRGHFPSGPAANREYSFILLHTSADKRSGGVSGALRGGQGRETGHGARAVDSSLATRHLSLHFPCPGFAPVSRIPSPAPRFSSHLSLSSRPAAGSRERVRKSHTGTHNTRTCALPAQPQRGAITKPRPTAGFRLHRDFPPGPERAGYCWTRTELPTTSGTCGIEQDCSAPSGLGYRFGSR